MSHYTSTADIAAALHQLADRLDAVGDITIAETWLCINLQAVSHSDATEAERRAAVDILSTALTNTSGEFTSSRTYSTSPAADQRSVGADVQAYTPTRGRGGDPMTATGDH